jgi:hypothetical protein
MKNGKRVMVEVALATALRDLLSLAETAGLELYEVRQAKAVLKDYDYNRFPEDDQ